MAQTMPVAPSRRRQWIAGLVLLIPVGGILGLVLLVGLLQEGGAVTWVRVEIPGPTVSVRGAWYLHGEDALTCSDEERPRLRRFDRVPAAGEAWRDSSPDGAAELPFEWFANAPLIGWAFRNPPFSLDGLLLEVRPAGVPTGPVRRVLVHGSRLFEVRNGRTVEVEGGSARAEKRDRWIVRIPRAP